MIIYGTDQCPDCIACKNDLDQAGVPYEYRDINCNLLYLKEFLAIRDANAVFQSVKQEGRIGIPAIVCQGVVSLSWGEFIK